MLGTGVAPWTYQQPKKGESTVAVSFSLDCASEDDVLYFEGSVDASLGPQRKLQGVIRTGYGRRVGDFTALPVEPES